MVLSLGSSVGKNGHKDRNRTDGRAIAVQSFRNNSPNIVHPCSTFPLITLQTLENEASQYPSEVGNYYCTDGETEIKRLGDLPKVIQKTVAEMGVKPRSPIPGL